MSDPERALDSTVGASPFSELWRVPCESSVIGVAATPNCSLISAATVGRRLHLLDGDGVRLWDSPQELDHEGWCTALSADGSLVSVGTASKKPMAGTVYVFDRRKRLIWSMPVGAPVWSISLSADGSTLAFGSWNNKVYRCVRTGDGYRHSDTWQAPDDARGIYGVELADDGSSCAANAYDCGLFVLDAGWRPRQVYDRPTGFYNVDRASVTGELVAGLRDGRAVLVSTDETPTETAVVSPRPVCGVAISDDGGLIALGSFDGNLYLTTRTGDVLWQCPTGGEVWSVTMSADGSLICLGSGDHLVRLLHNECSAAAVTEIRATESQLHDAWGTRLEATCSRLATLYLRHGIVEYGARVLRAAADGSADPAIVAESLEGMLNADVSAYPEHVASHYELGRVLAGSYRFAEAAHHFQEAARSSTYRSRALTRAGDAFRELGMETAAQSCFRRSRESSLDSDAQMILYNLGRSYEDQRLWSEAAKHFELLVAWNARYRDVLGRLEKLQSLNVPAYTEYPWERVDYTGLTASLLGPDTPRIHEVEEPLLPIVVARTAEILMEEGERSRMHRTVAELLSEPVIDIRTERAGLEYTIDMFLKYDYSLPEDQLLKALEAVTLFSVIDGASIRRSLDIGTATGRYPALLARRQVEAYGIDHEPDALAYAQSKLPPDAEWPKFLEGDALKLTFTESPVDLVTCMMGTFSHIAREEHERALAKFANLLGEGGRLVVSTWDIECDFLTYLSMYSEDQKERIRANSPTRTGLRRLFDSIGLSQISVHPVGLFPSLVVYDLALGRLDRRDVQIAVDMDLAARSLFPDRHGQMYIVTGTK